MDGEYFCTNTVVICSALVFRVRKVLQFESRPDKRLNIFAMISSSSPHVIEQTRRW
jgi:hypothetical protein